MKYLKLFEDNKLYQEIGDDSEFQDMVWGPDITYQANYETINKHHFEFIKKNWEDFTEIEIKKIMEFFPDCDYTYTYYDKESSRYSTANPSTNYRGDKVILKSKIVISNKSGYEIIQIYKLKDEWYYVSDERFINSNYKCDQFEGLLQCLKDNFS